MRLQPISRRLLVLGGVMVLVLAACGEDGGVNADDSDDAFNAEDYFTGRTVGAMVNHSAGGGSDLLARYVLDRMGEHIPGQPRVNITNQEGIGGLNNVYDASAEDLLIGVTSRASNIYTSITDPETTIDPSQVQLIGGFGDSPRAVVVFGDYAEEHPTLMDAADSDSETTLRFAATVGVPSDISTSAMLFSWLCDTFELNCDMIPVADDGSADVDLMLERGEVNADDTSMTTVVRNHAERILEGAGSVYFQYGMNDSFVVSPQEGLEVPSVFDVVPEDSQEAFEYILPLITGGGVGFTFFVGPEVPEGAVEILREAFITVTTEGAEEIGTLLGGGGGEGYSVEITPMAGADAQEVFGGAALAFSEAVPGYQELQEEYWERFWQ